MTETDLMSLLDEHKRDMPEICYIKACRLLRNVYSTKSKEMLILAISAECFARGYFTDDEHCVASKVKQRILRVRCTPVLDIESDALKFKSPSELLDIGKYRESWINCYLHGEYTLIPKDRYPIHIDHHDHSESVVIISADNYAGKRPRCDDD